MQVKEIVKKYSEFIVDKIGSERLEGIALIGSFSRNEGIAYQDKDNIKLISDIEYLLVSKLDFLEEVRKLSKSLEGPNNFGSGISIGFTTKRHLKRLKPCIFTIEAKRFGKVYWGDENILDLIPDYSYEDIQPIDGLILLNNRIIEQLILSKKINNAEIIYQYDIDKGYIQIVNSLLAFYGQYKSLYSEKEKEAVELIGKINLPDGRKSTLMVKIKSAFKNISTNSVKVITKEEAIEEWKILRDFLKEVWLLETRQILKNNCQAIDECINSFLSIPIIPNRIKEWLKLPSGRRFKPFYALNILRSTPQFLIYQHAVKEYFDSKKIDEGKQNFIIREWEKVVK